MVSRIKRGSEGYVNPLKGRSHSEESKKKKRAMMAKKKAEGYVNPLKGRKRTEETIQKIREVRAKKRAEGYVSPLKGKKRLEETNQKISEAWTKKRAEDYVSPMKGRKKAEGYVSPLKGKPRSEKTKQRIKETWDKKRAEGYVSPLKGKPGSSGKKHSEEYKKAASERMKQKYADGYINPLKGKKLTEEQLKNRKNLKGKDHPLYGIPLAPETRAKISKTLMGSKNPHTPEWNAKISAANKGRIISPETRAQISESLKGENSPNFGRTGDKHPMFGKKGPLNPNFGRKRTPEQRKRMSEGHKNKLSKEERIRNYTINTFIRNRLKLPLETYITDKIMMERLGYTKQQFIDRIESTFQEGMNWSNRGRGPDKWHIDHIKPVSAWVKEGITDPKEINALWNLQALWEKDNLSKSAKYNPKTARFPVNLEPWKERYVVVELRFPLDLSEAA